MKQTQPKQPEGGIGAVRPGEMVEVDEMSALNLIPQPTEPALKALEETVGVLQAFGIATPEAAQTYRAELESGLAELYEHTVHRQQDVEAIEGRLNQLERLLADQAETMRQVVDNQKLVAQRLNELYGSILNRDVRLAALQQAVQSFARPPLTISGGWRGSVEAEEPPTDTEIAARAEVFLGFLRPPPPEPTPVPPETTVTQVTKDEPGRESGE